MTSHLEMSSRAALCRQLAVREPNSKAYWLAEAESWLRLSRGPDRAIVKREGALAEYLSCGILCRYDRLESQLRQPASIAGDAFERFLDLMPAEDRP